MADQELRWGVLGPGRIAEKFARDIRVVDRAVLHAVGSRSEATGERFASLYGAAQVHNSYEALVSNSELDVIYIATPHRFHYEQAQLCLEAGKHVLCEKPITVNAVQAERLLRLAKRNDLFIMEAMWTYFLPIYQQVRTWLNSGELGEIVLMTSTFGIRVKRDENDRWLNPELAGGALLDIGVYNLAVSMWAAQQPVQEFEVSSRIGSTGVDEIIAATLVFSEGVISQFSCSLVSHLDNEFVIYGTKGKIKVHAPFWGATRASLITENEEITMTNALKSGGFEYQIDEVNRCIRAGLLESPVMPHKQTLASMRLMDAIRAKIGLVYPFE